MEAINCVGTAKLRSQSTKDARSEAPYKASMRSAFNGVPAPKYKGSDEVRYANQDLARRARKAEKAWRRTLRSR